jgi:hypothetical protein
VALLTDVVMDVIVAFHQLLKSDVFLHSANRNKIAIAGVIEQPNLGADNVTEALC